jgi:hypothetical protein
MHSQCAPSEPISSSRKTGKLTVCRFILTLYKKSFRYRLPVSPPRKRTKPSSSTPNLKSPSIRTPSLLKKSLSISNIYILSNGFVFISFMFKSVNLSILQKTINKTNKSPHAFAMCFIRTDLLKQENGKMQGMYMSKILICFFTARILQNQRMLCCGECFHD